jgi:hypothetical protein
MEFRDLSLQPETSGHSHIQLTSGILKEGEKAIEVNTVKKIYSGDSHFLIH